MDTHYNYISRVLVVFYILLGMEILIVLCLLQKQLDIGTVGMVEGYCGIYLSYVA